MPTIDDVMMSQEWLHVRCKSCGRSTNIPFKLLPKRLVGDLPVHLAAAFFRCGGCQSKDLETEMINVHKQQLKRAS